MRLTRKQLRTIKKKDNEEMARFIDDLGRSFYEKGRIAGRMESGVSDRVDHTAKLMAALEETRGIGPKLTEKILSNYKKQWTI